MDEQCFASSLVALVGDGRIRPTAYERRLIAETPVSLSPGLVTRSDSDCKSFHLFTNSRRDDWVHDVVFLTPTAVEIHIYDPPANVFKRYWSKQRP